MGRRPSSPRERYASARATPATNVPWQVNASSVLPGRGGGSAASSRGSRNCTAAGEPNHGSDPSTPLSSTAMTTGSGAFSSKGGRPGGPAVVGRGGVALYPIGCGAVQKTWWGAIAGAPRGSVAAEGTSCPVERDTRGGGAGGDRSRRCPGGGTRPGKPAPAPRRRTGGGFSAPPPPPASGGGRPPRPEAAGGRRTG